MQHRTASRVATALQKGMGVNQRCDNDRHPQVGTVYSHLKRTLDHCREQVDRIEEMLLKNRKDNDPRK